MENGCTQLKFLEFDQEIIQKVLRLSSIDWADLIEVLEFSNQYGVWVNIKKIYFY